LTGGGKTVLSGKRKKRGHGDPLGDYSATVREDTLLQA